MCWFRARWSWWCLAAMSSKSSCREAWWLGRSLSLSWGNPIPRARTGGQRRRRSDRSRECPGSHRRCSIHQGAGSDRRTPDRQDSKAPPEDKLHQRDSTLRRSTVQVNHSIRARRECLSSRRRHCRNACNTRLGNIHCHRPWNQRRSTHPMEHIAHQDSMIRCTSMSRQGRREEVAPESWLADREGE